VNSLRSLPGCKILFKHQVDVRFSLKRNGHSMAEKLSNEIIAASNGEGGAFKKKEDTHRRAEADKGFSHFKV
jgi:small subunit ribosomal protein S7